MCPHEEIGVPGPAAEGTREGSGEAISIDCGSPVIPLMEHSADHPANAISRPVLERNDRARLLTTPAVTVYWNLPG